MKGALKSFLITCAIFVIILQTIPAVSVSNDIKTFLIVALVFFLVNFFVRPFLKLLFFLPINLLTFNLVGFLSFFATFMLLPNFVPNFRVSYFDFGGFNSSGIIIPPLQLSSIQTAFFSALIMAIFSAVLSWIFD
jgi:uncharacterized membrane protein YvlD (DUF360 family)